MDTVEKGAYIMLLLSHYQIGGNGLPDDDRQLARICGVTAKKWASIRPILEKKFDVKNGRWTNKKVIIVLQKVEDNSSAQRAKALKRHSADDAAALPQHCQPETRNQKPDIYIGEFEEFWKIYPKDRAGSKSKALAKFKQKVNEHGLDKIMQGVKSYAKSDEVKRGFAKGCAAWLNDDRFLSKYEPDKNQGVKNDRYIGM